MAVIGYLIGATFFIAIVLVVWWIAKQSTSRMSVEKTEIGETKDLLKSEVRELILQRKEKRTVGKLIKEFEKLTSLYVTFYRSSSGTVVNTMQAVSMNPLEIINTLVGLTKLLYKFKNEKISVRKEKSSLNNFVKWWSVIFRQINESTLMADPNKVPAFTKAADGLRISTPKINGYIRELGRELEEENQLDETKKRELMQLFGQTRFEQERAA